jgi:hypothetical protein
MLKLPFVHVSFLDDGSTLIEFITHGLRMGFSLENPRVDSSWYLVCNKSEKELFEGEVLTLDSLEDTCNYMIKKFIEAFIE